VASCFTIIQITTSSSWHLYHQGVDQIFHHCLTHEEVEKVLNDFHSGACGGRLFGLDTTQKILCSGYFWPSIFKDFVEGVKKCHPYQVFLRKICMHPTPLYPIITINPFTKWGVYFMTCHLALIRRHKYIIMVINYFTKWVEAMPNFSNDSEIVELFIFKQIISKVGVSREIDNDHDSHI
jgi:hypothetical protein